MSNCKTMKCAKIRCFVIFVSGFLLTVAIVPSTLAAAAEEVQSENSTKISTEEIEVYPTENYAENDNNNDTLRWSPFGWNINPLGLFRPQVTKRPPALMSPHKNRNKHKFVKPPRFSDEFLAGDTNSWGSFESHPCRRVCQQGQQMTCYYKILIHNYQRLGPECQRCQYDANACQAEHCIYGDGVPTPVVAVNRMVPGPPIEVCENDKIIADVLNYLTEGTTMHWHGMKMSQTPESDGAPFTTQYPVQPGEIFRYTFVAERSGSVWYHSHVGLQRALGAAGNFIIRQSRQANRQVHLYDYDLVEHSLLIGDIVYNNDFSRVRNILVNGKGRNHLTTLPDNDPRNRYERLRVSSGYRYRMRVINNGVFHCPIEFSIENHKMLIIATDGNDVEPIYADSFFMASAERFDFILAANQAAKNYWIRLRGYGNCSTENLYQGAVLHYSGARQNEHPLLDIASSTFGRTADEPKVVVNFMPDFTETNSSQGMDRLFSDYLGVSRPQTSNVPTSTLRALEPLPWQRYTKFLTTYHSFRTLVLANGDVHFQIDEITFEDPTVSLLQGRDLYHDDYYYCNRSSLAASGSNCFNTHCECTNVIRLPAYKPIEMVIANYDDEPHPFHTHGYTYRLVGQDIIGNLAELRRIEELDRRGRLKRTPEDFPAVEKDTALIPPRGYIILRFISNNPGFWMAHCHIETHAANGMMSILKVGENHQIKRLPLKLKC